MNEASMNQNPNTYNTPRQSNTDWEELGDLNSFTIEQALEIADEVTREVLDDVGFDENPSTEREIFDESRDS